MVAIVVVLAGVAWLLVAALRDESFGAGLVDRVERLLSRWDVDLSMWRASLVDVARNRPTPRQLLRIMGWSSVNWGTDIAALWLVFAGLGEPLAIGVLLLAFGVENLAVMIPISPGGVGLVEAGMSGALVALGVPAAVAVAGILGYRILSYWLPMLAGIPQYLRGADRGPVGVS